MLKFDMIVEDSFCRLNERMIEGQTEIGKW